MTQVSRAIGMDRRIGRRFLQAGLGFGKPRFRKDILGLVYLCEPMMREEEYWACCQAKQPNSCLAKTIWLECTSTLHRRECMQQSPNRDSRGCTESTGTAE